MLDFLLYFFASIGFIVVAGAISFSYILRREQRSIDENDLDNYG